jgi:glutamate dehydrogenase
MRKEQSPYVYHTLCSRKVGGKVIADFLPGNEMNHILRYTVHQTKTDLFIPAGGRPKTLNETNYKDFLDSTGQPTSKLIVEGANLYITPWARRALEKLGVLIIKDSSANKGGVTCSSFEVLFSLVLSDEEFIKAKPTIVAQILKIIRDKSKEEVRLLLQTHQETGIYLTEISEWISEKINTYKDQLLAYFQENSLNQSLEDPFIQCLRCYLPPFLRTKYFDRILTLVPDTHKKAIIACYIASLIVYRRGVEWAPSLVDVLPILVKEEDLICLKSND